jgi:hypothetical protein
MRGTIVKLIQCSFGLTKNLGNYESVRFDLTAVFDESVETYAEVVDSLRTQVARELNFHGDYVNLCDKVRDKKSELATLVSSVEEYKTQIDDYQSKLANAKANWDKLFELTGDVAFAPLMSFFRHQDLVQNVNVVEADDRMAPSKRFNCDTGEGYDEDCDLNITTAAIAEFRPVEVIDISEDDSEEVENDPIPFYCLDDDDNPHEF